MTECAVQAFDCGGGATDKGAETPASSLIGTTLEGAYRITRLIAEGGMGAVYEAVQLRLNQRLAVKVMARELSSNQEALSRFQREADITSRLRHPHLVTVIDFGTGPGGQPYLVMEYLEGIDLDRRIRQLGKIPLPMAVHLTKQVASALAAAHEQGVVHRDLKPANVFLVELPGEPDFAKVLDFGISKVRAATTQLTKASSIIGTPNYMAPEQATGMLDDIDQRTDQWALACIVWEMLSGRPPFAADDMSAVFYQVIHLDPQPLRKHVPDLPAAVETVLRRALSKDMNDRFPSIRNFATALADAAADRPNTRLGTGGSATSASAIGVERRRTRTERRRSNQSAEVAGENDDDRATRAEPLWKKVRPIHALSCLTLAVAVAVLVTSRWSQPATAAAPTTMPLPPALLMVTVPTAVAAPTAMKDTPTLPEPAPSLQVGHESKSPAPQRAPKPKHAGRGIPHEEEDPFELVGRPTRASAGHKASDSSRHRSRKSAQSDFVDPFGP